MKLVNEREITEVFEFQNGNLGIIRIYVEEYKTVWELSAKFGGWACPVASRWKYSKKEYKTEKNAVTQFLHKLHDRY